ncbi:unnamed protein product [Musa hybrid cultivar]
MEAHTQSISRAAPIHFPTCGSATQSLRVAPVRSPTCDSSVQSISQAAPVHFPTYGSAIQSLRVAPVRSPTCDSSVQSISRAAPIRPPTCSSTMPRAAPVRFLACNSVVQKLKADTTMPFIHETLKSRHNRMGGGGVIGEVTARTTRIRTVTPAIPWLVNRNGLPQEVMATRRATTPLARGPHYAQGSRP